MISGRVPVFFDNISGALALVRNDKVRAIIHDGTRSPVLPDVPTVAETVSGFEVSHLVRALGTQETPRPIVSSTPRSGGAQRSRNQLLSERRQAGPPPMPLADIEPFVAAEIAKWADVIKRAGIKVD